MGRPRSFCCYIQPDFRACCGKQCLEQRDEFDVFAVVVRGPLERLSRAETGNVYAAEAGVVFRSPQAYAPNRPLMAGNICSRRQARRVHPRVQRRARAAPPRLPQALARQQRRLLRRRLWWVAAPIAVPCKTSVGTRVRAQFILSLR